LVVGALTVLPLLAVLALALLMRRKGSPAEYRLTSKGIVLPRTDHALLRWEHVSRHQVELDEESRHPILVVFFSKGSPPWRIPLSGDERDEGILSEIQKREVRRG
jgi:hypothetical protein